jgi:hypothetical protein
VLLLLLLLQILEVYVNDSHLTGRPKVGKARLQLQDPSYDLTLLLLLLFCPLKQILEVYVNDSHLTRRLNVGSARLQLRNLIQSYTAAAAVAAAAAAALYVYPGGLR